MNNAYTPLTLADLVFGNQNTQQMVENIANGRVPFPHAGKNSIILYGTYGTGKTTLARMLPTLIEQLYGGDAPLINFFSIGQGNSGTEVTASILKQSQHVPLGGRFHYFILDEADNLTRDAMQSLRSTMSRPDTVFILTTNNLSQIERGVQNRSHVLELNAAQPDQWLPLFRRVLADQNCPIPSDKFLLTVIASCNGSARSVISEAFNLVADIRNQRLQQMKAPVLVQPTTEC